MQYYDNDFRTRRRTQKKTPQTDPKRKTKILKQTDMLHEKKRPLENVTERKQWQSNHFMWWPRGNWTRSQRGSSFSSYNYTACVKQNRCLAADPYWGTKPYGNKRLGGWLWTGTSLISENKIKTFHSLDPANLRRVVRGRKFIFVGDSLAGEDFLSFVLMLLCTHKVIPTSCYDESGAFFPDLDTFATRLWGNFLIEIETRNAVTNGTWYIDEGGTKKLIRDQNVSFVVDLDKPMRVHSRIRYFAAQPGVVMVMNTGHWYTSVRSDVTFKHRNKKITNALDRARALTLVSGFVAKFLHENLAAGSVVIWHGLSPGRKTEHDNPCKTPHSFTSAILRGITPFLGLRQVFIDTSCAFSGIPDAFVAGMHFYIPGPPELGHLFIFDWLAEFGSAPLEVAVGSACNNTCSR
jgi:hypothetical protein